MRPLDATSSPTSSEHTQYSDETYASIFRLQPSASDSSSSRAHASTHPRPLSIGAVTALFPFGLHSTEHKQRVRADVSSPLFKLLKKVYTLTSPQTRRRPHSHQQGFSCRSLCRSRLMQLIFTLVAFLLFLTKDSQLDRLRFLSPTQFPSHHFRSDPTHFVDTLNDTLLLQHYQREFRGGSPNSVDPFDIQGPVSVERQFISSNTYKSQKKLETVPRHQWPPFLTCPYTASQTNDEQIVRCLLDTYFSDLAQSLPTLFEYHPHLDLNVECHRRIYTDIKPLTPKFEADPNSALEVEKRKFNKKNQGQMLRSYLSYLTFAATIGASTLSAGVSTHPYWRWDESFHESEWPFKKLYNHADPAIYHPGLNPNFTLHHRTHFGREDSDDHFSIADAFQFDAWEYPRELHTLCPTYSAIEKKVLNFEAHVSDIEMLDQATATVEGSNAGVEEQPQQQQPVASTPPKQVSSRMQDFLTRFSRAADRTLSMILPTPPPFRSQQSDSSSSDDASAAAAADDILDLPPRYEDPLRNTVSERVQFFLKEHRPPPPASKPSRPSYIPPAVETPAPPQLPTIDNPMFKFLGIPMPEIPVPPEEKKEEKKPPPPPPPKSFPITRDGGLFVLPSWSSSLLFDERILLVLEVRFWLRHTILQHIHADLLQKLIPNLDPKEAMPAYYARLYNFYLSPQSIRDSIERQMRMGLGGPQLFRPSSIGLNEHPGPHMDPMTYKTNSIQESSARVIIDRVAPELNQVVELFRRKKIKEIGGATYENEKVDWDREDMATTTIVPRTRGLNPHDAVFNTYFDKLLHVAFVLKQKAVVRTMRPRSFEEDLQERLKREAEEAEAQARNETFIFTGTRGGSFRRRDAPKPSHLNLGVPPKYLDQVVQFSAWHPFFVRMYNALPKELQKKLVLHFYIDSPGLTNEDLQPMLDEYLRHPGILPRLHVNVPPAVQVQQIALADVQVYSCVEWPQSDEATEEGNCAMASFIRSEPLKLFFVHPQPEGAVSQSSSDSTTTSTAASSFSTARDRANTNLGRFYPLVRNVMRLRLGVRGIVSNRALLENHSENFVPVPINPLMTEADAAIDFPPHLTPAQKSKLTQDFGRESFISIGNSKAKTMREYMQQVSRIYPGTLEEKTPLVPMNAVQQVIRFDERSLHESQRTLLDPTASVQGAAATAQRSESAESRADALGLSMFVREVKRVYQRKLVRLLDGGVPSFRQNYEPNYPKHKIIQPMQYEHEPGPN